MRHLTLLFTLTLAVTTFLAGPAGAQLDQETCRTLETKINVTKQRPGFLLGTVTGDLQGAVLLETIRESDPSLEVVKSIINLQFVDSRERGGFTALLSARTYSAKPRRITLAGSGEITEGKGRYEGLIGKLKIELVTSSAQENFRGEAHFCFQ